MAFIQSTNKLRDIALTAHAERVKSAMVNRQSTEPEAK
jgi:hypothetical protein